MSGKTMPEHFSEFLSQNTSPGLLIVPQSLSISAAAEELIFIWSVTEAEEWVNRIAFLPI